MLLATIRNGSASLTWESEGVAVAAGHDADAGRYLGLVAGGLADSVAPTSLVVQPAVAAAQQADVVEPGPAPGVGGDEGGSGADGGRPGGGEGGGDPQPASTVVTTFRGSVRLDGSRPVKHFGDISKEVLDHFAAQVGTDLEVTITVTATNADGFADATIRTISENARTLKFDDSTGFSES